MAVPRGSATELQPRHQFCIALSLWSKVLRVSARLNPVSGRGIGQSSISLLRFVLGDVDVGEIMQANPALGALFYLLFLFLVVLVAVSIFLAIVTNAYAEERANDVYVDLFKVKA